MADEGERIGGVYVDVGIDDEGVLARLDQIATALSNLAKRETTIKVKLVEEGSTTSSRTKKTPVEMPATLKLEANAAKKAIKGITLDVPVGLTLRTDAVSKLKAQINEAFQNFSIKVNVDYGSSSGGNFSQSTAQEEFAEATGLGRPRTKRVTRSSGPSAGPAPSYDRFYAVVKNTETLQTLKDGFKKLQADPAATQGMSNRFSGEIAKFERRIRVLSATPAGTLAEEQPQPVERPLVERVRRVYKRSPLTPKRIIPRPIAPAVMEIEADTPEAPRTPASIAAPTSTRTGQRRPMQNANDDPVLARIEQEQRRRDRAAVLMSGRGAGEPSKFTPRERSFREFDRTGLGRMAGDRPQYAIGTPTSVEGVRVNEGLVIRGPVSRNEYDRPVGRGASRRMGPRRNFGGPNPSRRFLDRDFAPNPITETRTAIPGLGELDPAAFDIINAFRRGEYGTAEEPLVERLNAEGMRVGERKPITDPQRRKALKDAGSTAFGKTFSEGRYRIVNPKTVAKERLAELGELPLRVQERIFGTGNESDPEDVRRGLLNNPRYRPGSGIVNGGGGYIGVSQGAGGAARSQNDTPQGNLENRTRVRNKLYQDALEKLRLESPDVAAAVEQMPSAGRRRAFLRPFTAQYGDAVESRALMKASPREFGFDQRRLTAAFSRYQGGYASRTGLEGYLGEDQQVTPASTYRAFQRKFLDQYKQEFGYKPSTKFSGLPEGVTSLIGAQAAKIRDDVGQTVIDYDKISATGGAGRRFVPGAVEEAAARIEPAGRATTKSRERRREYTPAEQQLAEIRARLERLEGTPETLRTTGQRGSVTEDMKYIPGSPGTAEEQRASAQGGATQVRRRMLGEVDVSRLLLKEVQARAAGKKGAAGIRDILLGTKFEENPEKIRALTRRLGSYGVNIPEGSGLPGGVVPGTDITPAANIGEARSRLARALRLQRGYRRMLPSTYAAADQERQSLVERGVKLDQGPIITDKTPLSGDELAAKLAGSPIVGRRTQGITKPSIGEQAVVARAMKAAADTSEVLPEGLAEGIKRVRAKADAKVMPEIAARKAAEGREPPLGGGTSTALGPTSGGPIPVTVVNFKELEGVALAGGGTKAEAKAGAKASEAKEPGLGTEAKLKNEADKLRAASQAQLVRRIQDDNPNFKLVTPERAERTGKSEADIAAEAQILQARSLNPTRAFQTAIAAAFAKTVGGGGAFEERVKTLSGSITARRGVERQLETSAPEYRATAANLRNVNEVIDQTIKQFDDQRKAGKDITPAQKKLAQGYVALRASLVEDFEAQKANRQELIQRRGTLDKRIDTQQKGLITPGGVVRGFTALAGGAIAGGLIFSAASQAVQAAIGILEDQASKAADALGGFGLTASKVAEELAAAVRSSFGDTRGAIAGAAAPSGISAAALDQLNRQGLGGRAEGIAAAQARVQESDLFRSANFLGGDKLPGGYDRSLFQGTGGILNTQLFAPQPGLLERVSDDLSAIGQPPAISTQPIGRYDTGAMRQRGQALENPRSPAEQEAKRLEDQAAKSAKTSTYLDDLNKQLERANSGFRYLSSSNEVLVTAMKKSADELGQGNIADKLIAAGVVLTGQGGRALTGTEFGQAAADLGRGQLTVDPEVAQQQDRRSIQAQVNQLARQREHDLNFSLPTQLSLENLAAPAAPVGTGLNLGKNDSTAGVAAGLQQANDLQAELNKRYEAGNAILKQIIPADLMASIESTGKAITDIQASISNQSAALQTHEYDNQLRVAKRTLQDIAGLTGKNYGYGKSQLGVIERQNFELGKQATLLSQQLAQRQINFQVAAAGFQAPGLTSEERAARIEEAKLEASYAQKQLDIQKKQSKNQFKLFDLQNVRAATDALAAIGLLKEGRSVAINTKVAEEKLQRLNKLQADNVKRAGKYLQEVEGQASIAMSEITKLETAYGKAVHGITMTTIQGFNDYIRSVYSSMSALFGSGDRSSNDQIAQGGGADRHTGPAKPNAAGFLGTVSGATSMIMGEAGAETVAILRNPRTAVSPTGGSGGGITININNPVVKEATDIRKIVKAVEQSLQRQFALTTPRRA